MLISTVVWILTSFSLALLLCSSAFFSAISISSKGSTWIWKCYIILWEHSLEITHISKTKYVLNIASLHKTTKVWEISKLMISKDKNQTNKRFLSHMHHRITRTQIIPYKNHFSEKCTKKYDFSTVHSVSTYDTVSILSSVIKQKRQCRPLKTKFRD